MVLFLLFFFFSSRRRHTRLQGDWSSDVCSSDLGIGDAATAAGAPCRKLAHRPFVAAAIKGVDPPWRVRPGAGTNGTADRRAATTAHRAPPDRRRRTLRSQVAIAQRG